MTRRGTGPSRATRDLIYERDQYRCRRCGHADFPLAIHHRRARGMGSTRRPETNGPANLLLVCEECHLWVESNRTHARSFGWLVRQGEDPADVIVFLADGWAWLEENGAIRWAGAA